MAKPFKKTKFGYDIRVSLGLGYSRRKTKAEISRKIEGLEAKFTKRINDYFRRNFGQRDFYESWKKSSFEKTKKELSTQFISSLSTNTKHQKKLINLYAEAWKNKYEDTINKYRRADPGYTQKPYRSYYQLKKKLKKEGSHPRHSQETVKFTTWGLSTGDLRDSIYKGFKSGGKGGVVKVSSLAVQGAYRVNWDYFQTTEGDRSGLPYPVRFMNHLIDLDVIDNYEDFIDFLPSDWDLISDYIMMALKTDFTDIMKKSFQQLKNEEI